MATAKNRALDVLRRERTARTYTPELGRLLDSEWTLAPTVEELFTASSIEDDMLRMMFSCCHPRVSEEGQVALVLHILCGFSVSEVASAFVSTHAAMEKRISRAKGTLANSKKLFDISASWDLASRLPVVHRALYLLFNEGYHGASPESAVRVELCQEAMRLVALLRESSSTATPATYALSALICLHAARLPARLDPSGELRPFFEQDRSQWDKNLVTEGQRLLEHSARGPELTEYHVEAAIAWAHANAHGAEDTDWLMIVSHYDKLMAIRPSPVVALNRAIAIGQSEGPLRGLQELHAISNSERLASYPFYHAALGEFEHRGGKNDVATEHFTAALALARNPAERHFLEERIRACGCAVHAG